MMITLRLTGAAIALAALAACNQNVGPPVESGPIGGGYRVSESRVPSNGEMRAICEEEAALRYNVRLRSVEVGRVQAVGRRYITEGRAFRSGRDQFFECRFGPRGGFVGVADLGGGRDQPTYQGASNREMRQFCEGEAARRYNVSRGRVEVGAVQSTGNGYRTEGRVRRSSGTAVFVCRFGPRGGFDALAEIGQRDNPKAVSNPEMRRFCEGEAARRYSVSRGRVEVGPVERAGEGFRTDGRVRNPNQGPTRFRCRFGPRGGFNGMVELSAPAPVAASRPEMRQACRREAAKRYNIGLGRVEVAAVRPVGEGFAAKGQTVLNGRTVIFECGFSSRGKLGAVRQLSP